MSECSICKKIEVDLKKTEDIVNDILFDWNSYMILKSNFKLFKLAVYLEATMDLPTMWRTKLWQRAETARYRALQETSQRLSLHSDRHSSLECLVLSV